VPDVGRRLACDGLVIEVLSVEHGAVRSVLVRRREGGHVA
jgi:hypothetical protein